MSAERTRLTVQSNPGLRDADLARLAGITRERVRQIRGAAGFRWNGTRRCHLCGVTKGPRSYFSRASVFCLACKECCLDDCRSEGLRAGGLCYRHERSGRRPLVSRMCSTGCGRKHYALGFCWPHYQRNRAGRDMEELIVRRQEYCGQPDCQGIFYARDRCKRHYSQLQREEAGNRTIGPLHW